MWPSSKKYHRVNVVLDHLIERLIINSNDKSVESKNYKDAMSEGQIIMMKKIMWDFFYCFLLIT